MNKHHIKVLLCSLAIIILSASCKKYLDEKPDQRLSTPDTLDDLQALMDNPSFYKWGLRVIQNVTDEYYLPYTIWQSRIDIDKQSYIWDPAVDDEKDWTQQYSLILTANTVLDNVDRINEKSASPKAAEIKGFALFLRSFSFFQLAQLFAPQYDAATADTDLGIVLRLEADFNIPSVRSTVQQTYDQIIKDLQLAVDLLPESVVAKTRPNKAAGYALLAKVYLQKGDYANAKQAANESLKLYNQLIDYSSTTDVNPTASEPFLKKGILNSEILYYVNDESSLNAVNTSAKIDSFLYSSYDVNDIRKTAFFRQITGENTYRFKGSYNGSSSVGAFVGLGTAEVYLIRAESSARLGDISSAMQDLNALLSKRYKPGTVPVFNPGTSEQALTIILTERKKEMIYRGVRWADIRRLNKNSSTAVTLTRNLNGTIYKLPPNDLRYTLLIPLTIIQQTNLEQNAR
ncbi:RagB/SusD family nutrient uptake outer membrane protein [Niastella sp. OAS944]|uniref:RagB/SusD family nutrient uptake outer membrane protein n=1 Tax=Niastella sp. OAS944 TaxID=2664089 RepID=UPI00347307CB|nr:tetratricopeptide (TPR) repeat protein [Chitinophagaceae bacterium OAS944]